MNKLIFEESLMSWYDQSKRILPWRDNPNPYHVWISEIMLQQTRVETVIPFFNRFIEELPTIESLSQVDDDRLNKLWEGLGYYSRARNLKKAALIIMNKFTGEIPRNQKDLESLPGIGPYTSGAILSIAFNQSFTAVDGNVLRVFARLLGIRTDIKDPNTKKIIKKQVEQLLPSTRVGDFNQGLMEIGAKVCLPNGKPTCSICPLNKLCYAYNNQLVDVIPVKQKRKAKRQEDVTVFLFEHDGKFAIEKRSEQGLLAGLYQFPNKVGEFSMDFLAKEYNVRSIKRLDKSKHIFTHLVWNMSGYHIKICDELSGYKFVTPAEIESVYSIPTAFKHYRDYIKTKRL